MKQSWYQTIEGSRKYTIARNEAQALADQDGFDWGIERNDPLLNLMDGWNQVTHSTHLQRARL